MRVGSLIFKSAERSAASTISAIASFAKPTSSGVFAASNNSCGDANSDAFRTKSILS